MKLQTLYESSGVKAHDIMRLRPEIVVEAQRIYDEWDGMGGGICDQIAEAIIGVINRHYDVDADIGGFEGDDHAYVVIYDDDVPKVGVDIPARIYESGGGYAWSKIEGVVFDVSDVHVWTY